MSEIFKKPTKGPILGLIAGGEDYGVRRAWMGILTALRDCGEPVVMVALADGGLRAAFEENGFVVHVADHRPLPKVTGGQGKIRQMLTRTLAQLGRLGAIQACINEHRPRALLVRSPLEAPLAALAARRAGIPAYWLLPNGLSDQYPLDINRKLYRLAFRYLNLIPVANSHYTATTLGRGNFKRHVVHLGVDPAEFLSPVKVHSRGDLGLPEEAIVIGIFARLVPEKGQLQMIQAIERLGESASSVHLAVFGGPLETIYADELRRVAAPLGNRVRFFGPVTEVSRYYDMCDIIANTRLDPEPFGLSVIEAMMTGKPVLAHKAGGPGETVIDDVTGWHIRAPSVEAFMDGVSRMLNDRQRWPAMSEAARQRALSNFTHTAMVGRLLSVIDSTGPEGA
ncbi:MAG: glycosyltransferase family 4 protein [Brevundimonas sp.]